MLTLAERQFVAPAQHEIITDIEIHQSVVSLDPEVGQVGHAIRTGRARASCVTVTVQQVVGIAPVLRISVPREELQSGHLGKSTLYSKLAGVVVTAALGGSIARPLREIWP